MIDFIKLCNDLGLDYSTKSEKVREGWIGIDCPFCPTGYTKKKHLGYNTQKNYFYCWRCGFHSIKDVLNHFDVKYYDYERDCVPVPEKIRIDNPNKQIKLPGTTEYRNYHSDYLLKRRYNIGHLIKEYKIQFTDHSGDLPYRIVIPIFKGNQLVSYQTRICTDNADMRYITCSMDNEIYHHKHLLYNENKLTNTDKIIVVEGIFDAWRIGKGSVATFGTGWKHEQIPLIGKYKRRFILFDNEEKAQESASRMAQYLTAYRGETIIVNIDKPDPDSMTYQDVIELKKELNFY